MFRNRLSTIVLVLLPSRPLSTQTSLPATAFLSAVALLLALNSSACSNDASRARPGKAAPPDLELRWPPSLAEDPGPAAGSVGTTELVHYEIHNVGGSMAFACRVFLLTYLKQDGGPPDLEQPQGLLAHWFQPGPDAGDSLLRQFELPLTQNLGELCLEVRLTTLRESDPRDPVAANNRICRTIETAPSAAPHHHLSGPTPHNQTPDNQTPGKSNPRKPTP